MDSTTAKRFVRALRAAEEDLLRSAKCFCYTWEPEYKEILTNVQFSIRQIEHGEPFAGRLLYKMAQNISPTSLEEMVQNARSEEERGFFRYIGEMNKQRTQANQTK